MVTSKGTKTYQGKRIALIPLCMNMACDIHDYSMDARFFEFLEFGPNKTLPQTQEYIKKLLERIENENAHYWGIFLKCENKVIGTIGATSFDGLRNSVEIGYGINPQYWGMGYFKESLNLVCKILFTHFEIHRIYAKTDYRNISSIKGLSALGFTKEGELRNFYKYPNGQRANACMLSILKPEFDIQQENTTNTQ